MTSMEDEVRADPREFGELVLWLVNRLSSFPCPVITIGESIGQFIERLEKEGYTMRQEGNGRRVLERVVEERTASPQAFEALMYMLDVFLPEWRVEHYRDHVEYTFAKWRLEDLSTSLLSIWRLVLVPGEYRLRSVCVYDVSDVVTKDDNS